MLTVGIRVFDGDDFKKCSCGIVTNMRMTNYKGKETVICWECMKELKAQIEDVLNN